MNKNAELRLRVLDKALQLFRARGVKATTIKLIAAEAGCTNAALYYYFENGKNQILEEVLRSILSAKIQTFEQLDTNVDFPAFIRQIGLMASRDFGRMTNNISWLVIEFPDLPSKLQQLLHVHLSRGPRDTGRIHRQVYS